MFRIRIVAILPLAILSPLLQAQAPAPAVTLPSPLTTSQPAQIPPQTTPKITAPALPADPTDNPQILVSASENSLTYHLTLDSAPLSAITELRVGPLVSTDLPGVKDILALTTEPGSHSGSLWDIPIHLSGMIPFGASTVAIYRSARKIETLSILKPGLALPSPPETQLEGEPLLLVVQNPTGIPYASVRARLRFKGRDVCTFSVEQLPGQHAPPPPPPATAPSLSQRIRRWFSGESTLPPDPCEDVNEWTSFAIPRYSGISLRASDLPKTWFSSDDGSGALLSKKGALTLRFSIDPAHPQALDEQIIPLEAKFQPSRRSRIIHYLGLFSWLLFGALGSLLLRVVIPNSRRFRAIRDQLGELNKSIRSISQEVDSMLRVQLIVEHLSLKTLSGSVWRISPSFADNAQRTEAAIATLRRRIDYVRRLDAALSHRRVLIADELAQPTRIAAIDRSLNGATEELKSDQFRDQDWVLIQQSLEAADKLLGSPTEEDKATFETVLVQRWKSLTTQYGFDPNQGWLNIPDSIQPMEGCFPSEELLCPRPNPLPGQPPTVLPKDYDIYQWIKTAGTVRADLQITALELIREVQFLAPAVASDRWKKAMEKLVPWLSTPAFENLLSARLLLRELSETITPEDIAMALQRREASIEVDPQTVGIGERVHLAIRFRLPNWNSAASRREIVCEWRFKAEKGKRQSGVPIIRPKLSDAIDQPAPTPQTHGEADTTNQVTPESGARNEPAATGTLALAHHREDEPDTIFFREKGWEVYHFFEIDPGRSPFEVRFFLRGTLLTDVYDPSGPSKPLIYSFVFDPQKSEKSRLMWEQTKRAGFESFELLAALLVPLCALVVSSSSNQWWQLIGLGFGSDTIRNVLSGASDSKPTKPS